MPRPDDVPDHLQNILRRSGSDSAKSAEASDTELPYGWLSPKPLLTLHFEWPDGRKRGFRYMHLDSDLQYSAEKILLRFFGSKPVEVTIARRNLERVYLGIGDDRWRILRQQARDFVPTGETFISKIEISALKADG